MRIIIDADPSEAQEVLALVLRKQEAFSGTPRPGWGWAWPIASGKRFMVRETKTGFSASPVKPQK